MRFCNKSSDDISIAVNYYQSDTWITKGWWIASPGECVTPLGSIDTRYIYFHAHNDDGSNWPGATDRDWKDKCVIGRRFEFHGTRSSCGSGRLERFGAVDTGDYTEFTYSLSSSRRPDGTTRFDDSQ
jgi:uncharacterized membrane protein